MLKIGDRAWFQTEMVEFIALPIRTLFESQIIILGRNKLHRFSLYTEAAIYTKKALWEAGDRTGISVLLSKRY